MTHDEYERLTRQVHSKPEPQVTWLGHPVIGILSEGGRYESAPILPEYEIGLRDDGVVVWRTKEVQQ